MISEKGISGNPPTLETLDFGRLRERGIQYIQNLAGDIWTDYNLHDPGVTLLEILCYALTDTSFRTEQLRNAFRSDLAVADSYIKKYLFDFEDLIPSLPVTRNDFEKYIEDNHEVVISAWVNTFPLMGENEIVKGGYELSVFLKTDSRYDDLNSDVLEVLSDNKKIRIQVIFFDEDNNRLNWNRIGQIRKCTLDQSASEPFFQFEKHNGQVPMELELKWSENKLFEKVPVKARVAISGVEKELSKNTSINRYRDTVLKVLESDNFNNALLQGLEKEHFKNEILNDIRRSLLPVRGLCEDFVVFKVVNLQEIKVHVQITLASEAPDNNTMLLKVYNQLDDFILNLVTKSKTPGLRDRKNVLYTSNIIEELTEIKGIKAVQIESLNLFVDGIPTISLQDEGSFDCLFLQNFSRYVPKISREKSVITFIRDGLSTTLSASEVSAPFTTRSLEDFLLENSVQKKLSPPKQGLTDAFFEEIKAFYPIQEEFPENYQLVSGKLPDEASGEMHRQQKRFKSYLLFYERLFVDYLERLSGFSEQLSMKPDEEIIPYHLNEIIANKIPDVKNLELIQDIANTAAQDTEELWRQSLEQKNRILDHLLARFSIKYKHLEARSGRVKEEHIRAKIRLLKNIPEITRERGLGLPLSQKNNQVWDAEILSGPQKRIYRLLGIGDLKLTQKKLTDLGAEQAMGFYLVEHRLLVQRPEHHVFDKKLNRASGLIIDYLNDLQEGVANKLPFTFTISVLIPNWGKTWSKNKRAYEQIIREEIPAHIVTNIHWVDKKSLNGFEVLFEDWLTALLQVNK